MNNLLQLLLRYSNALLFFFLEVVAIVLVVTNNEYQKSAVFSSCNTLAAGLYTWSDNITNYFTLHTDNQRLAEENTALRNRINQLENQLQYTNDSITTYTHYINADKHLTYLPARVINTSTNRHHNYLTLNKGRRDGIKPDMGVISHEGVVGIICAASEHFALVIPLIHTEISVSSKFSHNNYVGSLHWKGRNCQIAQLHDIARHVEVHQGDSIVTSGLSAIFPANIPIGTVEESTLTDHDAFHNITIRLAVDFKRLNHVTIIQNHNLSEQKALEDSITIGK